MPEVEIEEVRRFMEDSLKAVGTPNSEAKAHAALLLQADLYGHFSHGLNRLELYINDCKSGATNPKAKPVILKESPSTAWVDGCDGLGATVGNFCMELAIKKAKETGVGWVSAKSTFLHQELQYQGCNHFGMAGWWAKKAEEQGLIGLAFTNSSALMVPTRAKDRALGTNPVGMCAPAANGDSLLVDMASTTVAMGKIEVQIHRNEPIPEGWALGPDGNTTTDAKLAFDTGKLLPLGGAENTSGYKGYGLSALVEIFCSGLSASKPSHEVRDWELDSQGGAPDLGQCFAAIDPGCFAPGFTDRVAALLKYWRSVEPVDPDLPVLAPGDKERIIAQKTMEKGTITYSQGMIERYCNIANKNSVRPMKVL